MDSNTNFLKVSKAFEMYLESKNNNTLVQDMISIFDGMTEYIRSSKQIDSNFDLLFQLSLISKDEGSDPESQEKAELFKKFFKVYVDYLAVKGLCEEIAQDIHTTIIPLISDAKIAILNFLWELPGFRKSLINFKTTNESGVEFKGVDYTKNSIFTVMMSSHKREYTDNAVSAKAFGPLSVNMPFDSFNSVFGYLMKIIRANRPYTFDNVLAYRQELSSYELLGTVLILFFDLIKNNPEHVFESDRIEANQIKENLIVDVWDAVNILYFTLFEIKKSTSDSYKYNNDEYLKLDEQFKTTGNISLLERIKKAKENVDDGKRGLDRILKIISALDHKFIESTMFSNTDYVINGLQTSILCRFRNYLLERGVKPNTLLSKNVCYFTNEILKSRMPAQVKSEFLRYVMAYSLSTEYVELGKPLGSDTNAHMEVLTDYLRTDARKLENIKLIHSFDVLEHFSRHLYLFKGPGSTDPEYGRCIKAIRLYLGYLEGANELYELIISSFMRAPESSKAMIIKDMTTLIGYTKDLIDMVGLIGHEALEYIDPLMSLIDKIVNTKELMNIPPTVNSNEIAVIDQVKPTCIKNFRPWIVEMFQNLNSKVVFLGDVSDGDDNTDNDLGSSEVWNEIYSMYYVKDDQSFAESVFRFVIKNNTIRVLNEIFNIDLEELGIPFVRISDDVGDIFDSDLLDEITCDLLVSPVAIPISASNDSIVLVNQKTMYKILLDGTNPYTRQPLSYDDIIEINSRPDVREKLNRVFGFIKRLTN